MKILIGRFVNFILKTKNMKSGTIGKKVLVTTGEQAGEQAGYVKGSIKIKNN